MERRRLFALLAMLAVGLWALSGTGSVADDKKEDQPAHHHGPMAECAKACAHCMLACESCARHCAELVAGGHKEHMLTLGTCADCAEFCATAGKIVARHGPMAVTICEACAKACDTCGEACEKHLDDAHMKECAKACRDCAKACRDMIQHAGHQQKEEK
jgi:hypothetical protein